MKIKNFKKILAFVSCWVVIAALLSHVTGMDVNSATAQHTMFILYLSLLLLAAGVLIYIVNVIWTSEKSVWRFKVLFLPVYLLILHHAHNGLPIDDMKYDLGQKILIGIFYAELVFLSNVIKKESIEEEEEGDQ